MNYKYSNYNIPVLDGEKYILFNTRTLAMAEINEEYFSMFSATDSCLLNQLSEDEINMLLDNGFIIPISVDELNMLKNDYWENKFNCPTLHISIMTTLDCNFKCFYCFEKKRKLYLNDDKEKLIYDFISQQINNFQNLQIDWYGGEPLLNIEAIKRLSEKLINLCNDNNVNYNASITTNGYGIDLLSEEELERYKVSSVQVTIDGIKDIHDQRRVLINGSGTYDKIIQNIINRPNTLFDIRVNVDNQSYMYAKQLFDELKSFDLKNINISIKGIVSSDNNPCYDKEIDDSLLPKVTLELYDYLEKLEIPSAFSNCFDTLTREYCVVDTNSQYIISPDGAVFKCGEAFDDSDPGKIGVLDSDGLQTNKNVYKWLKDPFAYDECLQCNVLPLCMGGCQLIRNVKKSSACHSEYKYGIKQLIKNYYNKQYS